VFRFLRSHFRTTFSETIRFQVAEVEDPARLRVDRPSTVTSVRRCGRARAVVALPEDTPVPFLVTGVVLKPWAELKCVRVVMRTTGAAMPVG